MVATNFPGMFRRDQHWSSFMLHIAAFICDCRMANIQSVYNRAPPGVPEQNVVLLVIFNVTLLGKTPLIIIIIIISFAIWQCSVSVKNHKHDERTQHPDESVKRCYSLIPGYECNFPVAPSDFDRFIISIGIPPYMGIPPHWEGATVHSNNVANDDVKQLFCIPDMLPDIILYSTW